MNVSNRPKPVVLCILDGLGERAESENNALHLAQTPVLDRLRAEHGFTTLAASGRAVGLPTGKMGNSEIGHATIGAGRVIESDVCRINSAIAKNKFSMNPMLDQTMRISLYHKCPIHLMGLLSDGGIHSDIEHLFALIDVADFHEIPVVVHVFTDGRDSPPRSALDYLDKLERHMENKQATIGTISGRYYAMDRDERWDRVERAFHAIVRDKVLGPEAPRAETPFELISQSYQRGENDEFIVPTRIGDYQGLRGEFMADFATGNPIWEWTGEDPGFMFNFRADRIRQLTGMLTRQGVPDYVKDDLLMDRHNPVRAFQEHYLATMTSYGKDIEVPVAFQKQDIEWPLGQVIANAGLSQLRCAESEKFPHVTYFLNGGRQDPFEAETRHSIPSPRLIETYDEKPQMNAAKVTQRVIAAIEEGQTDFVCVNFANPDMLGHTGKLDAAITAVETVDAAVGEIANAVERAGGALIVTADHGNCEQMVDEAGRPHTAHTTNPVPFILVNAAGENRSLRDGGSLADVAPTVIDLLDLQQPEPMTGRSLLEPQET